MGNCALKHQNSFDLILLGLLGLFLTCGTSLAVDLSIGVFAGSKNNPQSTTFLPLGSSISLFTSVDTDAGVEGFTYRAIVPTDGWTLLSRDYATYEWDQDGFFDFSSPQSGNTPALITDDLFGGASSAFDYTFDSIGFDGQQTIIHTGTFVVEDFEIMAPLDIPKGFYTILLADVQAFDGQGEINFAQLNISQLTVNVIPEPGTWALFSMMIVAMAGCARVRGRNRSCAPTPSSKQA